MQEKTERASAYTWAPGARAEGGCRGCSARPPTTPRPPLLKRKNRAWHRAEAASRLSRSPRGSRPTNGEEQVRRCCMRWRERQLARCRCGQNERSLVLGLTAVASWSMGGANLEIQLCWTHPRNFSACHHDRGAPKTFLFFLLLINSAPLRHPDRKSDPLATGNGFAPPFSSTCSMQGAAIATALAHKATARALQIDDAVDTNEFVARITAVGAPWPHLRPGGTCRLLAPR